jgi:mannose-6-phosphate isomerase-like protein (cupin superfamily)
MSIPLEDRRNGVHYMIKLDEIESAFNALQAEFDADFKEAEKTALDGYAQAYDMICVLEKKLGEERAKNSGNTGPNGMIRPEDMKFVPKRWGWELHIYNGPTYCGKKMFIKQGHNLSYHHHNVKDEVLYVDSGTMWFSHGTNPKQADYSREMPAGYAFHVKPGLVHQMFAETDVVLFEFSTHHEDEDSIRATTDLVRPLNWVPATDAWRNWNGHSTGQRSHNEIVAG